MKKKVCMIVQDKMVKGGIATVINGYRGSMLEEKVDLTYIESYKDGGKVIKISKAISAYYNFLRVVIKNKPDIVHIHSSFGASFYRKIPFIYMAKLFNITIINHIHGADFDSFYKNANKKKKQLVKKIYGKCDVLIALSDEWKVNLSKIISKNKVKVIGNYSVINKEAIKQRKTRKSGKTVLFLGEIGKRKGCYDIPEVASNVIESIPDVRFIIAGDGEDTEIIKKNVREKGIENNVLFPGWVRGKDKDKLLKECDIFFLPSYNEGMPMAILDAMGYGIPIVSTNVGGIPKIVNRDNGFLVNAGDKKGFSEAIINLLNNEELGKSCSNASYEIVKERYSLEHHINQLKSLYYEL